MGEGHGETDRKRERQKGRWDGSEKPESSHRKGKESPFGSPIDILPHLPPETSYQHRNLPHEDLDRKEPGLIKTKKEKANLIRLYKKTRIDRGSERIASSPTLQRTQSVLYASMSANASAYWRLAGMSYIKYANLCADMVRSAMKEPQRAAAKAREQVYYRSAFWKEGKMDKQGASFRTM